MNNFIDYLNINEIEPEKFDLIIFYGRSGAGKSTQIQKLLEHNQTDKKYSNISASPIPWGSLLQGSSKFEPLICIDEISQISELKYLKLLLSKKHHLIVASHVHPAWFSLLRLRYKSCIINLDQQPFKINMRLQQLNLQYSAQSVRKYLRCYGASFTEIDIILERYHGKNFDQALRQFQKLNKITLNPIKRILKLN